MKYLPVSFYCRYLVLRKKLCSWPFHMQLEINGAQNIEKENYSFFGWYLSNEIRDEKWRADILSVFFKWYIIFAEDTIFLN